MIITGGTGTVTIVFQTVGASTERMAQMKDGDGFLDFARASWMSVRAGS